MEEVRLKVVAPLNLCHTEICGKPSSQMPALQLESSSS